MVSLTNLLLEIIIWNIITFTIVAENVPLSINALIELIANSQQKSNRILSISPRLISGMPRMGDFLHLPFNSERVQKLTESYVVSNAKIVAAIGKPLSVEAKEGLLRTMKGFSGRL